MEIERKILLLLKIIVAVFNVLERELQERIRNEKSLENGNNNDRNNYPWGN